MPVSLNPIAMHGAVSKKEPERENFKLAFFTQTTDLKETMPVLFNHLSTRRMIRINSIKLADNHILLAIEGALRSEGVQELTNLLSAYTNEGIRVIEIDLEKVNFVSGTGIRLLKLIRREELMSPLIKIQLKQVSPFIESLVKIVDN
jgi:anti-anti-sigma regulatory factor